jgi:phosphotransferase system  glucose/maltose/N-acetylglucosamine-specific IIC component
MNRQNKDYLEKDFEKHQPKIFMPIMNTIIAIAAVVGFFLSVMWPKIQESINTQWDDISTQDGRPGN